MPWFTLIILFVNQLIVAPSSGWVGCLDRNTAIDLLKFKTVLVTIYNGESRLCFSSKQVEYARYYLKAVGLVDILLPLPNSHYLLTKSIITSVSPIYFSEPNEIKKHLTRISKNNKKIKNTADPLLGFMRNNFDLVHSAWASKKGTWISMDFEAWELFHKDLTEFGYAFCDYTSPEGQQLEEGHWIVAERKHLRNVLAFI